MIKFSFLKLISLGFCCAFLISSCQEDEDIATGEPSTVYFNQSRDFSSEGDGKIQIPIMMDKAQNAETLIHFKLDGNALQYTPNVQNPDFKLLTDSPITIKKGETSGYIEIQINEDSNFEQDLEYININLDYVLSGNAVLSPNANQLIYTHEIVENDYMLYLETDSEVSTELNMFVELPNKDLLSSNHTNGMEEIILTNVKDQVHYYIDIWYQGVDAQMNYTLTSLSAGSIDKKVLLSSSFNSNNSKSTSINDEFGVQNYKIIKDGKALKILN